MKSSKTHKEIIENLFIEALQDDEVGGGLDFNSNYASLIDEEINKWKENTFNKVNEHNFYEINLPFSNNKFYWPKKSYGKLDHQCLFSFQEFGVWLTYLSCDIDSTIWDVGSHHGIDTFVMHSMVNNASVLSFEPEPDNCESFRDIRKYNLKKGIKSNTLLVEAGLSDKWEISEFIRVKGNTMASHIRGNRPFHGEVEELSVQIMPHSIFKYPDFMKINIEGHEKILVPSLPKDISQICDIIIEIHSIEMNHH